MPKLSQTSKTKLFTCHQSIIDIVQEVIKITDFTVIYGHRTGQEQLDLFNLGREFLDGNWIITDKKKIVTYCDGYNNKSKHNEFPSMAIDLAPCPIDWNDFDRFNDLAEIVLKIASERSIKLKWGGNFKTLKDYPHFELEV